MSCKLVESIDHVIQFRLEHAQLFCEKFGSLFQNSLGEGLVFGDNCEIVKNFNNVPSDHSQYDIRESYDALVIDYDILNTGLEQWSDITDKEWFLFAGGRLVSQMSHDHLFKVVYDDIIDMTEEKV